MSAAAETAQRVLLEWGLTSPPPSVSALCEKMGIITRMYDAKKGNRGCCSIRNGKPHIFVDKKISFEERRFTLAHELGHLMQGHVGGWTTTDGIHIPPMGGWCIEHEADTFAAELLMPACVLIALGANKTEQIMQLCDVGYSAARRRLKEIRERKPPGSPLSLIEQRICQQFGEYIRKNKITTNDPPVLTAH